MALVDVMPISSVGLAWARGKPLFFICTCELIFKFIGVMIANFAPTYVDRRKNGKGRPGFAEIYLIHLSTDL
jgi:hypothetical protein